MNAHAQSHTSYRISSRSVFILFALLTVFVIFSVKAFGYLSNVKQVESIPATPTLTVAQLRQGAITASYDNLARRTEEYIGQRIRVRGRVVQVLEGENQKAYLRVRMDGGGTVGVRYIGPRLLESDKVNMVARVEGRYTYKALLGNQVTIVDVTALWLEVEKPD